MPDTLWKSFDADRPSGWDERKFAEFVAEQRWTPAPTMEVNPHEYTLRRDTSDAIFDAAVRYIRERGLMERVEGKRFKALALGGHKYWTMGASLPETILINRRAISRRGA
jgi:hypothetical protein